MTETERNAELERQTASQLFECMRTVCRVFPAELIHQVLRQSPPMCRFCHRIHSAPLRSSHHSTDDIPRIADGFGTCYGPGCLSPCAPCILPTDWPASACHSCTRPLCAKCSAKDRNDTSRGAWNARCGGCSELLCIECLVETDVSHCKGCGIQMCGRCAKKAARNLHIICRLCMDDKMEVNFCFLSGLVLVAAGWILYHISSTTTTTTTIPL
ncbi:hypothetical protein BJ741DRAFT_614511 [Chytriomyces cf. hyalinus JEL632]|nr:hypothetical protein BJ741DRAFT_614511 [Chytriomyces cf. hyalinus JEL632]